MVKGKIKKISIRYAKQRKWRRDREEKDLRQKLDLELEKMEGNPNHNIEEYVKINNDLNKYEKEKCMGAIIRSKAQYAMEGEKCTSFFLRMEKQKQMRTYISELENEKGENVNDLVGILDTVFEFYSNLFKKGNVDNKCIEEVLENVEVKITDIDKDMCDDEIALDEIKRAISSIQIKKSPGRDGLTSEF